MCASRVSGPADQNSLDQPTISSSRTHYLLKNTQIPSTKSFIRIRLHISIKSKKVRTVLHNFSSRLVVYNSLIILIDAKLKKMKGSSLNF